MRCNYCNFMSLQSHAKQKGLVITKLGDSVYVWAAGVSVYMHSPEVDIKALSKEEAEKYFKAWYAELPDHCCC